MAPKDNDAKLLTDWGKAAPPWSVFKLVNALAAMLQRARDALMPPPLLAMEMTFTFVKPQILYALVTFGIPEHLAGGRMTAAELSALTGVREDHLWRLLRTAFAMRMIGGATDRQGVTRFSNNALSAALREDHPNSVKYMVTHLVEDSYPVWAQLVPGLKSDRVPWSLAHPDEGVWEYFKNRPESEQRFSKAMTTVDNLGIAAALADYRWGDFNRVLDIGGAYGSTLAAVMDKNSKATGVLFDLPQVIENAKGVWNEKHAPLLPRTEFVSGSFLDEGVLPVSKSAGDVYVMRVVLHDWTDADTIRILKNVRAAIGDSGAKLAIMEATPLKGLETPDEMRVLMDMHMLAMFHAAERTKEDWEVIFGQTGFKLAKVYPTRSLFSVVEAVGI